MWPGLASHNTSSVCLGRMVSSLPVRRLHEVPWAFSGGERALYKRALDTTRRGPSQVHFELQLFSFLSFPSSFLSFFFLFVFLTKAHLAQASLNPSMH